MFVTSIKHKRFSAVLVFLLLFGIAACAAIEKGPLTDPQGWVINREFLSHSKKSNKKVELFWTKPSGDGPYAAVL
jgi:predicted small lipoprotein YifL